MFEGICSDMVVLAVKETNIVLIVPYITPENSLYKNPQIFSTIDFIVKSFSNCNIYVIGDLNARCGDPVIAGYSYTRNTDSGINAHGRKLVSLCNNNHLAIVNGLIHASKIFESDFTFFRGKLKSQNDWCVTNSIENIDSFLIIPKLSVSDHCPLSLKIRSPKTCPLVFINEVSRGIFSYELYDRSKIIKPKLTLENINTDNLINKFDNLADFITQNLQTNDVDTNVLSVAVSNKIYESCREKKKHNRARIPDDRQHLSSHNFRAIADANLQMYVLSLQRNDTIVEQSRYFRVWESNLAFAAIKEKLEYNVRRNTSWQYASKNNPKKLWKMIDYKGDNDSKCDDINGIDEKVIQSYFRGIFEADRLVKNPTIADINHSLVTYHVYVPVLDDNFTFDELDTAIRNVGRGVGIDSIEKRIALLFSVKLRTSLLDLFNHVFNTGYPNAWTKQLLRPEKKKGHSEKEPKLRGSAVTQLLPTLYDVMLFNRFNLWYYPNAEQAGFRPKQGCLIQIFAIYVAMEFLNSIGKSLYIGFLDYEKAFDFINRANLIEHLKEKGAGSKFVRAVASMYKETSYIPKICNRMGKSIIAKHGVTQGRQTSTSFFSFEVQDMTKSVNVPASILNKNNLLQLADDTALLAEERSFLRNEFQQCLQFSADNYMYANVEKTFFLNLSDNVDTEPIVLDNITTINPTKNNEYVYLGMKFVASNDLVIHIKKNLKDRMFNVQKFYDWLDINESTPIKVKPQVLYTCMFSAYLYGVETWCKIDIVGGQLLLLERKLLRSILCVKQNTPDELLYIELDRHDIVASIKLRQYNFFQKLLELSEDDAVSRRIVSLYRYLPICSYYDNLDHNVIKNNKCKGSKILVMLHRRI